MSATLADVRALVARGEVRISDHGYDELADDGILADEVLAGLAGAVVVEDYWALCPGAPAWRRWKARPCRLGDCGRHERSRRDGDRLSA